MKTYQETRTIKVALTRIVKGKHPGTWESVSAGTAGAVIEIEVDIDAIARTLGERAVKSKGKKSVDGFVTVRAHTITHVHATADGREVVT